MKNWTVQKLKTQPKNLKNDRRANTANVGRITSDTRYVGCQMSRQVKTLMYTHGVRKVHPFSECGATYSGRPTRKSLFAKKRLLFKSKMSRDIDLRLACAIRRVTCSTCHSSHSMCNTSFWIAYSSKKHDRLHAQHGPWTIFFSYHRVYPRVDVIKLVNGCVFSRR